MKFTAEIRYPTATPDQVYAMLCDPGFQEKVCLATGALDHSVDVEPADGSQGGATITTTRKLPAEGLPDFVRTFVGETLDVMRVDHWGPSQADGSRRGTIVVEIHGTPVRLSGTVEMRPQGAGTIENVEGDLKASVPLVGGKIERAAEPAVRAAVAKEQEIGHDWLGASDRA